LSFSDRKKENYRRTVNGRTKKGRIPQYIQHNDLVSLRLTDARFTTDREYRAELISVKIADMVAFGAQSNLINNEIFPIRFSIFELPDPDGTMG